MQNPSSVTIADLPSNQIERNDGRTIQRALALAIVLAAFALRAWGLTTQSLWSDEGISINRSLLPVGEMLALMPVEHAPGYFLLLGGWLRMVGVAANSAEFALRYFSLLPGVFTVALGMRLARDLAHDLARDPLRPQGMATWLALATGILLAVNPTQHWFAQEGRMYTWLLASVTLATWALWQLLHAPSARRWPFVLLYGFATAASVYLHYFGALAAIAQAIYVVIWAIGTRRWSSFGAWLAGAVLALLLFAPWIPRALGIFGFSGWREGGVVSDIPLQYLSAYFVGYTPPGLDGVALIVFVAIALLGALWWTLRRAEAGLLILLQIAVPMAAVVALALRNPDFHPRYTLFVSMPLLLLVAAGVLATQPAAWRKSPERIGFSPWHLPTIALLAALVAFNLSAIYRQQSDTALYKPNFRGAVARVLAESQPGDILLVDGPDPELVIQRYYTGGLPLHDLREAVNWSTEEVNRNLREISADADRAWELLYFHDPAAVQVWTATQAYASAPSYHQGIRVTLYGLDGSDMRATTLNLPVADALSLITGTVQSQAAAGDLVRVRSDWYTASQAPELRFSLRMTDAAGKVLVSDDYVPQNWFAPTNIWLVDAPARDQRALAIPLDAPPGDYTITLRVYDPVSGAAITTAMGEEIPLGTVEVTP